MLKRRVWKPIAGILFLILLFAVAAFVYFLLKVDLLPAKYLIAVYAVLALLVVLVGFLFYHGLHRKRSKYRRIRRIIGVVLAVIITLGCVAGCFMLERVEQTKQTVTNIKATNRAVLGMYVFDGDAAQTLPDVAGYRIGVLGKLDRLNTNYALGEFFQTAGTGAELSSYAGISDAAAAMEDGSVQALLVNKSFLPLLNDTETYKDFNDRIRLVADLPVPVSATAENTEDYLFELLGSLEPAVTPAPTPEPTPEPEVYGAEDTLIFYLNGIDNWEENDTSHTHGDVNILMAVNARTHQILLVNTPRDFFVDNVAVGSFVKYGGGDKLTHCAVQGIANSEAALENEYDIRIDNYAKINFTGFERLIDTIGGIDFYNPVHFQTYSRIGVRDFPEGDLHLDGFDALEFARERHALANGDLGRGANQMRVVTAIIEKIKSSGATMILNYGALLDTLGGTFETDLTPQQISDLAKIALEDLNSWEVKSYGTIGASGKRVTATGGVEPLYITWPNQNSVNFSKSLFEMIENDEVITDEYIASAPRW